MIRLASPNNGRKPPWKMDVQAHLVQTFPPAPPGPSGLPMAFSGPADLTPVNQPPDPTPARKYQLQMRLTVGNPNRFPITFNALVFRFRRLDGGSSIEDVVEQVTTWSDDDKLTTRFFYEHGSRAPQPEEELRQITIAGRQGIILPRVPLGGMRTETNEHGPTRVSGHVYCDGQEVAYPMTADLPPRSAIPEIEKLPGNEAGLPLRFVRKTPGG